MPPFGKIEPSFSEPSQQPEHEEMALPENIHEEDNFAPQEDIEQPIEVGADAHIEPEPVIEDVELETGAISQPQPIRINKKKLYKLIVILCIIIFAIIFLGLNLVKLLSEDTNIATQENGEAMRNKFEEAYIDDNESQNKLLKEDAQAKQDNVNVFAFDINKCLEKYSEEQCVDMFDKNLLVSEGK